MIHRTDRGDYVISSHQVCMPGAYESERAARYAFRFCDDRLHQAMAKALIARGLWASVTFEELRALKATRGFVCSGCRAARSGFRPPDDP